MSDENGPKWQSEEWDRIRLRRERAFGEQYQAESASSGGDAGPKNLVGLSLSGGGIRSALYNDGFLQGLSHRGFFRYVDYLCSVSGGGYIAGHLVSQSRHESDQEERCFHDDEKRRDLGRDPVTGEVDANRLAGVGGYLNRTLEFLPGYLWSFFFSFAFYIGMVGIVATLAALFWRSFDDPTFRTLYFGTLGLVKGNELMVAFIPTILLGLLAVMSEAVLSSWQLAFGLNRPTLKWFHSLVRKVSLVLLALAILTSIAIFIGNGKTNVRSNASGELFLNNYAQFLAIAAGIIQILVFLGRDRLFRSERAEAKQWQKHLQRGVTTAVLLFLIFSMVHWMGREDISAYTKNRDPHLVRGDVTNWYVTDQLFSSYESITGQQPAKPSEIRSLNPLDEVDKSAKPPSKWIAFLVTGREGLTPWTSWTPEKDDLSQPPSPLQQETPKDVWTLPQRFAGAFWAYYFATFCSDRTVPNDYQEFSSTESVCEFVEKAFDNVHFADRIQDARLTRWNKYLEDRKFTSFLIDGIEHSAKPADSSGTPTDTSSSPHLDSGSGYLAPSEEISKLVASTDATFTGAQRKTLLDTIRRLHLNKQSPVTRDDLPSERLAMAAANRLLLEALLPGAVQQADVPSTLVVPPHDQRARWHWLSFWAILALVGMLFGLGQHRIATVFQFYRRQLGAHFLVDADGKSRQFRDTPLHKLNPTADGLPYPLMLAATLEPSTCRGSYRVDAQPFVFSPLYCGNFTTDDGPVPSQRLGFSSVPESPAVTLGDAVTLSGAAVTPLMTGNPWLSVILDFFNTSIAQRLRIANRTGEEAKIPWPRRMPKLIISTVRSESLTCYLRIAGIVQRLRGGERDGDDVRRTRPMPFLTSTLAGLTAALLALFARWFIVGPSLTILMCLLMCLLAGLLAFLASYCIIMRVGTPGLVYSLIFPRDHHGKDSNRVTKDEGRSFYVADGGFYDYLGVSELLRRRCELIVVSDTGANIGNDPLGTLAQMCEKAAQEMGVRFLDLDHEAPIDFGRLELNEQRLVHQPYLCMRIRYPDSESSVGRSGAKPLEGRLFYCQMSITESDPIEIQHIRNRFPSFPDEPTVNQFYSEEQVSAYRALGYHIANRLCNELQSWRDEDATAEIPCVGQESASAKEYRERLSGHSDGKFNEKPAAGHELGQPWFDVLRERLLTAYRLACYEELSYRKDDIFSEAIWLSKTYAFPAFPASVRRALSEKGSNDKVPGRWLREYEHSADVRSAYRTAVIHDINQLSSTVDCFCGILWFAMTKMSGGLTSDQMEQVLAAHLANIATACQEIHRGRPHSTFQIGGREKLIHLCRSFAKVICPTLHEDAKHRVDGQRLVDKMDQMIAELIELERSVFQGGEHVTTISFAQCMSTMWGRIVRSSHGLDEESVREELAFILQNVDSRASSKSLEEAKLTRRFTAEFQVTELRHRLDVGLKRTRVRLIREALFKTWCIGYFNANEIQAVLEYVASPADEGDQQSRQRAPVTTKKGR